LALAARPDFVASLAALLGVLLFDTLPGLFIGIAVSLLLLLYRASRPHVAVLGRDPRTDGRWSDLERHPDNERVPGVVVLRPESALFFANADAVRDAIRAHAVEGTKAVVLDAETVPAIDVTAVGMLVELADELRRDGIELVLARDVGEVRDLLQLGAEDAALRTYPTVRAAVEALRR
jgi:sulfate permease, SulP family